MYVAGQNGLLIYFRELAFPALSRSHCKENRSPLLRVVEMTCLATAAAKTDRFDITNTNGYPKKIRRDG